ncbi:YdcF family protein [Actinomadura rupiterrae]|uniref:YdcF family protein n=1 Tax=Actinomadura rupiterrae TaxID=559627 RepID=UPI0020A50766|nr:YdcF family protein [Actinomadura rupiterrae]MCP2338758.1 uncharacterized SAM-binding protein YcdF (DUF218 family) [Actinomadura rupiterrae]
MTMELDVPENEPEFEDRTPAEGTGRKRGRKRRRPRPRWFVVTVGVIGALLGIIVATPLTVGLRVWYQARQDERPRSDAIIVLGAAQYNGVPQATLKWRLQHALDLYQHGVAPRIVTVGGKAPGDNFTEGDSGRRWLIRQGGLPADKVISVPVGRDTLQSLKAVGAEFKRLGLRSGVIVTDPWHELRAKRMASDNGIDPAGSPTRSGPSVQTRDTQFHYIVRETGGYLSYVLFGKSVHTPEETIKGVVPDNTGTPSTPPSR